MMIRGYAGCEAVNRNNSFFAISYASRTVMDAEAGSFEAGVHTRHYKAAIKDSFQYQLSK